MDSVKKFFGLGQYPVVYVKSSVDGKEYLVRDLPDKQEAANLLAKVRIKLNNLKIHLEGKHPDKPQVKQLIQNFKNDPKRFLESTPDAEFTSYSVNKGEELFLCIRSKKTNEIHDINDLLYVAIHEIAHIGCPEIGHTNLFFKITFWLFDVVLLQIWKLAL